MPDSDLTLCMFEGAFIFNRGEVGGGAGRKEEKREVVISEGNF